MILWFGNKKKKDELKKAGEEMLSPEQSGDELASAAEAETITAQQADRDEPQDGQPGQAAATETIDAGATGETETFADTRPGSAEAGTETPSTAAQDNLADPGSVAGTGSMATPEDNATRATDADAAPEAPSSEPSAEDALVQTRDAGFFARLSSGLSKTSSKIGDSVTGLFTRRKLDDEALEDLEDLLLTSDMGAKVAARISASLARTRYDKDISDAEMKSVLAEEIETILKPRERIVDFSDGPRPRVVLFVGVNGSGKTTTIGKIAAKLKAQGAKALLVAGDTFRAAAIEQLSVWGDRAGIPVLAKAPGADAAGLVYEAVEKARREDLDLVLVDTAGRLQNKTELMSELAKIIRVLRKLDPDAPHDVILVLDATVGQNALSQVEAFRHTAEVSGLVMTKLDGTAKGGVLVAIAEAHDLPIHFVGVGEKAEDLQPFSAKAFARALVGLSDFSSKT